MIGSVTVIVLFALENLNFQVMREYSLTMFIVQAVLVVLQIPFSITGIVGVAKKNEVRSSLSLSLSPSIGIGQD